MLRRHLQPGAGRTGPLQTVNGGYVMEKPLVDLDLDRFDTLYRHAQQSPAWASDERALHAARVTAARILAAETATALLLTEESVDWANQALVGDPLNEHAWTALILGLERAGRHTEGLQAFETFRRALALELGCSPGLPLRAAQARLLRATADGEFSDVLSALLLLQDQFQRAVGSQKIPASLQVEPPAPDVLREAGIVLDSFLRRVRVSA